MSAAEVEPAERKLITLDRRQSLRLLATVPVGRLIFTVSALPAVRVMNYVLTGDLIVMRTAAESTAVRKAAGSVVAFEADQFDGTTHCGWSVTVTGRAELATDAAAVAFYGSLGLAPWAPGQRDRYLTISTEVVYGQQILPLQSPAAR